MENAKAALVLSLRQAIEELAPVLDTALSELASDRKVRARNGLELIMSELTMFAVILSNVDYRVSAEEMAIMNDIRRAIYGEDAALFNSADYEDLCREYLRLYPKGILTLDTIPDSIEFLLLYDHAHGTFYADKARDLFIRFAEEAVTADHNKDSIESILLSNIKEVLSRFPSTSRENQSKGNTTGIVFHFRSKYFQLVDIQWGKDNSFYFLPHQHDAEVGERVKTELDEAGRLVLHPNELQSGCFPTKKISRKQSGFFHIKDVVGAGGNREKDGLRGAAFKDMNGFFVILAVCPQAIDTLVEIEKPELTDIVMNLPDPVEPFTVQFAVWDKKRPPRILGQPGEYLGNRVVAIGIDNLEFGLIVMFVNVKNLAPETVVPFPVRTCYIVR
jgi:hypothetical protein